MNPITGIAIAFASIMIGACWSIAQSETARYECIVKVSTTIGAEKAKEICW